MTALFERMMEKYSHKSTDSYLNFFNSLEERKNISIIVNTKPFILYFDPASMCNLQCPFCPTGRGKGRKGFKMDFETFKHIIDHLGEDVFHIGFYNWGEPLLNRDFENMIRYLQKYYISTEVSTNISLQLSPERIKDIIESGLDKIIFSVDGATQKNYEKYRKNGDLELVFKNMKMFVDEKIKQNSSIELLWRFFVFKHNENEVELAKQKAAEIGVDIKFASPFVDRNSVTEWASTLKEFPPQLFDFSLDFRTKEGQVKSLKTGTLNNEEFTRKIKFADSGCDWLWFSGVLNSNGGLAPCCITIGENDDFGNVSELINNPPAGGLLSGADLGPARRDNFVSEPPPPVYMH